MPTNNATNTRPRNKAASAEAKSAFPMPTAAASPTTREPRGVRRKRETRKRLLEAAFRLMAERGMDAVAINEITEAADVGFGTFYNHFESRDAIYSTLMNAVFENFGNALDRLVKDIEDPAEIIAVCIRHTLLRARREPLWGRFLIREGLSPRLLTRGLGVRLMRDMQKGVASARFTIPDPIISFLVVGGGVLAAISAELHLEENVGTALSEHGLDRQNLPARTATVLLHNLGLTFKQAEAICRRPLPLIDGSAVL
jgi:AcrR family transcriptional regulator